MKKAAVLLLAICMFSSALSLAVPVRGLNVSSCALKARDSSEYSPGTAWDMGYKGDGVNIAILDTGVDDGHESLDGRFVAGVDLSKGDYEIEGNPDDTNGHGTHCAGIALGDGGGDGVFAGAAPEAGLLDVKIASALGFGATMDGIEWCEQKKDLYNIRVLSISYGDFGDTDEDGSDSNCRKANAAVEAGLILVVSAGNDGPDNRGMGGLAAADRTICVAAVDDMETVEREDDVMATFSSRGPRMDDGDDDLYDELKPDVSAPGVDISAPDFSITGQHALGYVSHSGTSMACPHVAGVVALMLGANPSLTPEDVKDILHITAEPRGQPDHPHYPYPHNKWNREYGYGMVDAHAAVQMTLEWETGSDGTELEAPTLAREHLKWPGVFRLSWSTTPGAESYTLQESRSSSFTDPSTTTYSGSSTGSTITKAKTGTYYYRIKASNSQTESDWSSTLSVEVDLEVQSEDGNTDQGGNNSDGEGVLFTFYGMPVGLIEAGGIILGIVILTLIVVVVTRMRKRKGGGAGKGEMRDERKEEA